MTMQRQVDEADVAALERILDMAHELILQGPKKPGEAPQDAPPEAVPGDEQLEEEPVSEEQLEAAPEKPAALEEFHFVGGAARPSAPKEEEPPGRMPVKRRGRY